MVIIPISETEKRTSPKYFYDIKEYMRDGNTTIVSAVVRGRNGDIIPMETEMIAYILANACVGKILAQVIPVNNLEHGKTGGVVMVCEER